jgi:hypothetical protein
VNPPAAALEKAVFAGRGLAHLDPFRQEPGVFDMRKPV